MADVISGGKPAQASSVDWLKKIGQAALIGAAGASDLYKPSEQKTGGGWKALQAFQAQNKKTAAAAGVSASSPAQATMDWVKDFLSGARIGEKPEGAIDLPKRREEDEEAL